jgi:hypothetical protein
MDADEAAAATGLLRPCLGLEDGRRRSLPAFRLYAVRGATAGEHQLPSSDIAPPAEAQGAPQRS